MFRKWFAARSTPKARTQVRARLQVESLEDRVVPTTLVAVTTTQRLLTFDSATPTQVVQSPVISNLSTADETIVSIDSRPASGVIYGLSNLNLLYTLDPSSAVATPAGAGPAAFAQTGMKVAIDFNPTVDRLRVVTNAEQNFRINPNTGAIVDGDAGTAGTQPDTPLAYAAGDPNEGANPAVVAAAYDRNAQGVLTAAMNLTTLFGIDANLNRLVRIGGVDGTPSPNLGALSTVGGLGLDIANRVGFEIDAGGTAFASFANTSGVYRLYTINLATGAATSVGKIGSGSFQVAALTSLPRDEIVFATTATNRLISFRASDPNTLLSSRAIAGLGMGETIAGIDFRPLTGQLFALTSANRTLIINANSGMAVEVGAALDAALIATGTQAGFDFNPTVDRLRLVNGANDNLRFNPVTSTPTDGDAVTDGIQPDTDLAYDAGDANVGMDPNINAVAYDRNDLDGATATTLFAIDSTLNNLVRQGGIDGTPSPNGGLLTTLGSLGVDPTDLVGFDISNAGTMGNGAGLAVMQLTGDTVSKLFAINLAAGLVNQVQGTATLIGTVGGGELITAMAIAPASIQFSSATYSVMENGVQSQIAITRTGGSGGTATVTFSTSDGTAVAPADYTAVGPLVVTFAPGVTTMIVNILIAVNNGAEVPETVNLSLSTVTGGNTQLGAQSSAVLTITE